MINNFSDQRDETALYNDLSLATQGNKTPQEFYDHCQTLFSTIMTYVTLHETVSTTIEAKRDLYKKVTMQAYVRGLKEPLGSRIRCMRPPTIEKALEFVQEELNVMYLQQRETPKAQAPPRVTHPTQTPVAFTPRPHNFPTPVLNWPVPMGQRPAGPTPQPFKFPAPAQHQHRMPTNTQRMFSAAPPNYNPRSNIFRLPPRSNAPQGPQPMSGVQRFTPKPLPPINIPAAHDWNKFGNPPPSNYFKAREMNMNECMTYDDSYYNYFYEPVYNYYADYNDSDFDPSLAADSTHYNVSTDDQVFDESQAGVTKHAQQDFQETSTSQKPR